MAKPARELPETTGPGYVKALKEHPEYTIKDRHVYHEDFGPPIAEYEGLNGKSIGTASILIEHPKNNNKKLKLTLELAALLEREGCSDFSEDPPTEYLKTIFKYRF